MPAKKSAKQSTAKNAKWTIDVIAPKARADDHAEESVADASGVRHSGGSALSRWWGDNEILPIDGDALQAEWDKTMSSVLSLANSAGSKLGSWKIDEISVGLTLSAKGKLLFIAEAGAQASFTVKLKNSAAK